jgi:hypothetical protein
MKNKVKRVFEWLFGKERVKDVVYVCSGLLYWEDQMQGCVVYEVRNAVTVTKDGAPLDVMNDVRNQFITEAIWDKKSELKYFAEVMMQQVKVVRVCEGSHTVL